MSVYYGTVDRNNDKSSVCYVASVNARVVSLLILQKNTTLYQILKIYINNKNNNNYFYGIKS